MILAFFSWASLIVGQRGLDASVVGDLAVLDRNIEVNPHEQTFSVEIEIANGKFSHSRWSVLWKDRSPTLKESIKGGDQAIRLDRNYFLPTM